MLSPEEAARRKAQALADLQAWRAQHGGRGQEQQSELEELEPDVELLDQAVAAEASGSRGQQGVGASAPTGSSHELDDSSPAVHHITGKT